MRQYNIESDLVLVKPIEPIVYKQYDNGDTLEVELYQENEKIQLTDEIVLAFFQLNDATVIQKTCTIRNGNAIATLDNNILSIGGNVKVEFTVYDEGKETTTRTLLITVESSINRNVAIETVPQWDIVNQIIVEGPGILQSVEEAVENANQAAAYADNERQLTLEEREATSLVRQVTEEGRIATISAKEATEQATAGALNAKEQAETAAAYATREADDARVQKELVAQVIKNGPVASVNGQTGMITGLAKQSEVDSLTTMLANKAQDIDYLNLNKQTYRNDLLDYLYKNSVIKPKIIYRVVSPTKIDIAVFYMEDKATVYTMQPDADGWWRLFGCVNRSMTYSNGTYTQGSGVIVMQDDSRKEFAFNVKPEGSGYSYQWVPEHGVTGVMTNLVFRLFIDNREVTILTTEPTTYTECGHIRFVTDFDAKHPSVPTILWHGRLDQIINGQGFHTSGKFKFLTNTDINTGYPAMLAMYKTATRTNKVLNDFGIAYHLPISVNDNSDVIMDKETGSVLHYTDDPSATSSMTKTVACMRVNNLFTTMRYSLAGKGENPVVSRLRSDGERKTYFKSFDKYVAQVGDVYSFSVTYFCGEIIDAKNVIPGNI